MRPARLRRESPAPNPLPNQGPRRLPYCGRFQREIDFLSGLRHPNVIQYLGSCVDPETRMPILFMELMDESLTSFLERPADAPPLPLHVQVDIGHDVAQAVSHLHRQEVLHRDLSSNNVLLIGSQRAKVTDFGMAKLLGSDPHLTPTYCPGTNAYMSPEALADPPAYTRKLDVFSCGVLFVQLITRKWPKPGPRTYTVQVSNDPRFPSGRALVEVPELERRKEHLDLISPTHPLLDVALDCLKDKEGQRPTAEQLCSRLITLKESTAYRDSLQQTPEEMTGQTPPARDQELEQQLRESELRVEDLTREVQQLQMQNEEQASSVQQKNGLLQQKDDEIREVQQQIEEQFRENERVVATLQQCIEQKDGVIQAKDELIHEKEREIKTKDELLQEKEREITTKYELLQEKEREIKTKDELLQEKEREMRELQQRVTGRERRDVVTGPLKLEWRDGPAAPFATFGGYSIAVSGHIIYGRDAVSGTKVLMFNSKTEGWSILPECPKTFFSIAVVDEHLTAIGGKQFGNATKTLLSLPQEITGISKQKWKEMFPPMMYSHNNPAVTTTHTSLIVAAGWGPDEKMAAVEVLNTQTLQWSTVANLPHDLLYQAKATICGDRLYLGGGYSTTEDATKSVIMCEVKDLLSSRPRTETIVTRLGYSCRQVWKEVAPLPVVLSSLVSFQGYLLAVGGVATSRETSSVWLYDVPTNSWNVISQMRMKRCNCFVAALENSKLIVYGGRTPDGFTSSVEIASVLQNNVSNYSDVFRAVVYPGLYHTKL